MGAQHVGIVGVGFELGADPHRTHPPVVCGELCDRLSRPDQLVNVKDGRPEQHPQRAGQWHCDLKGGHCVAVDDQVHRRCSLQHHGVDVGAAPIHGPLIGTAHDQFIPPVDLATGREPHTDGVTAVRRGGRVRVLATSEAGPRYSRHWALRVDPAVRARLYRRVIESRLGGWTFTSDKSPP